MSGLVLGFALTVLCLGVVLVLGGLRGAKWLVREDAGWPWGLFNTRDFVRRVGGEKGVRAYAIVVGILFMIASTYGIMRTLLSAVRRMN